MGQPYCNCMHAYTLAQVPASHVAGHCIRSAHTNNGVHQYCLAVCYHATGTSRVVLQSQIQHVKRGSVAGNEACSLSMGHGHNPLLTSVPVLRTTDTTRTVPGLQRTSAPSYILHAMACSILAKPPPMEDVAEIALGTGSELACRGHGAGGQQSEAPWRAGRSWGRSIADEWRLGTVYWKPVREGSLGILDAGRRWAGWRRLLLGARVPHAPHHAHGHVGLQVVPPRCARIHPQEGIGLGRIVACSRRGACQRCENFMRVVCRPLLQLQDQARLSAGSCIQPWLSRGHQAVLVRPLRPPRRPKCSACGSWPCKPRTHVTAVRLVWPSPRHFSRGMRPFTHPSLPATRGAPSSSILSARMIGAYTAGCPDFTPDVRPHKMGLFEALAAALLWWFISYRASWGLASTQKWGWMSGLVVLCRPVMGTIVSAGACDETQRRAQVRTRATPT